MGAGVKLYEIVNPSDACTLAAESDAVACAAVLALGSGAYGLSDEQGGSVCPVLLFASPERTEAELQRLGVAPLGDFLTANKDAIAACLDSVRVGSFDERRKLDRVLAHVPESNREGALAAWDDERRTSMSRIAASAKSLAKRVRSL